jgi:DNA-directed RNA polymerase II subunit RPB3
VTAALLFLFLRSASCAYCCSGSSSSMTELSGHGISIDVLACDDANVKFRISGPAVKVCMVNALRRAIIADVATLAIDDVTVYKNTSALDDEVIAHRLGLVPIDSSGVDSFQFQSVRTV